MAEGTYEYECMRAELLGLDHPDYDEFMKTKKENEAAGVAEEDLDTQQLEETALRDESLKNVHGGLEELNSILQNTQKKISRFRQSCGSLTSLLKFRIGSQTGSTESMVAQQDQQDTNGSQDQRPGASDETTSPPEEGTTPPPTRTPEPENGESARKSDLTKALDRQVDSLDSLCDKMENAQYSMSHQTKQMKKFTK